MYTRADKTQENNGKSVVNESIKRQINAESTFQVIDNRPESVVQRKLSRIANNSPQVRQLKAFQKMASNSPQAKQTRQLHLMANHYASKTVQQKESLEEDTLQETARAEAAGTHPLVAPHVKQIGESHEGIVQRQVVYDSGCQAYTKPILKHGTGFNEVESHENFELTIDFADLGEKANAMTVFMFIDTDGGETGIGSTEDLAKLTPAKLQGTVKMNALILVSNKLQPRQPEPRDEKSSEPRDESPEPSDESLEALLAHEYERHLWPFFVTFKNILNLHSVNATREDYEFLGSQVLGEKGALSAKVQHEDIGACARQLHMVSKITLDKEKQSHAIKQCLGDFAVHGVKIKNVITELKLYAGQGFVDTVQEVFDNL